MNLSRAPFLVAFVVLLPVLLFVLATAVVAGEGEPREELVIKPAFSLGNRYGGGEEGQWERQNPGKARPWWLQGNYVVLLREEEVCVWWVEAYLTIALCVKICVPLLAVLAIIEGIERLTSPRRGDEPNGW